MTHSNQSTKPIPLHIEELTEFVINKLVFSKNLKNELFILVGDGTGDFQMEKIGVWNENKKKYVLHVNLLYYGNINLTGYWIEDLLCYDLRTFVWTNNTIIVNNHKQFGNYTEYPAKGRLSDNSPFCINNATTPTTTITITEPVIKNVKCPIYTNNSFTDVFTFINDKNNETDTNLFIEIYDMKLYKTKDDILYIKTSRDKRVKIGFWQENNFGGCDVLFDDDNVYNYNQQCQEQDRYDIELGF